MCNTHVRVQVPPRAPKGTSPDWARSFFISFFHVAKQRLPALAHLLQGAVQEQGQLQGAAEALLLAALGPEDGALPAGVLPEEDADIKGGQLPRRALLHLAMGLLRLHHRAKAPHGGKSLGRQLLVQEMLHLLEKIHQADERHPGVLLSLGQPTNGSYLQGAASKGGYLKLMRDDIQQGKSQDGVNLFLNSTGSGQLTLSHVTDTGDSQPKAQLVASDKNSWLWLGGSSNDYYNPGQALWYDFDSQRLNINANIKLSGLGFAKRWVSGFNYVANYTHLQTDSNIADANRLNAFAARLNMVFDDLYQITTWLNQTSGGTGFNTWQCT